MPANAFAAVEKLYSSDWGRIVATLIRVPGDFDLAEEFAQEAFAPALHHCTARGTIRAWTKRATSCCSRIGTAPAGTTRRLPKRWLSFAKPSATERVPARRGPPLPRSRLTGDRQQ